MSRTCPGSIRWSGGEEQTLEIATGRQVASARLAPYLDLLPVPVLVELPDVAAVAELVGPVVLQPTYGQTDGGRNLSRIIFLKNPISRRDTCGTNVGFYGCTHLFA